MVTIERDQVFSDDRPRYLAIAEALTAEIESGRMAPESRLPPQRDLAYHLGVTVGTVTRAYGVLARRRLVGGHVGRGTYVKPRPQAPSLPADGYIDLTRNAPPVPPPAGLARESFLALADDALPARLFDYAPTAGDLASRTAMAAWTRQVGLDVRAEQLTIFGGTQQALAAAFMAFGGAGALVEAMTYPGLLSIAQAMRLRLTGVALDDEGARPDGIERAARESGARLLVLVPTLQNPHNTVMGETRRQEIAALARRLDLILVEDDVYGFAPADRPPPLACLAPERTIYATGASKCLAPGLRVAWTVAPEHLRTRLEAALYAMSVCRPPLTAEIVRRWIESGAAAELLAAQRRETALRQDLASELLIGRHAARHPASFHAFMHLPEAWTPEAFAAAARERGIGVVPAAAFAVDVSAMPRAVRISLSQAPDRDTLERALTALGALAADVPHRTHGVI